MTKTVVIAGGGVVGLNIALALAESGSGDDVFLLEREEFLGHHSSTRNSEVVHAGFAYPPGSLKARLCVEGNKLTYDLLGRLGVPFRREGKWIVAHDPAEADAMDAMLENARLCGVPGMRGVSPDEVVKAAPFILRPLAAALSESSGIMDAAAFIRSLEVALSKHAGVQLVYPCGVEGIDSARGVVETTRGEMPFDFFVNAAGLFADEIYRMAGGARLFEIRPFKGEYCTWRKGKIGGLVYPVPRRFLSAGDATMVSSMGIHAHRSVAGELFIGPTQVEMDAKSKTDYRIVTSPEVFSSAMAGMLACPPPVEELEPAFAGNRPKLFEDGVARGDFEIFREGPFVHLLGIESPGLTAAPAIAEHVLGLLRPKTPQGAA